MLASLVVKLTAFENIILPCALGRELRSLIYNILSCKNPAYSNKIHNMKGPKPFSLSLLMGKRKNYKERMGLDEKNIYSLRITTLTKDLFESLIEGLFLIFSREEKIKILDKDFRIKQICLSGDEHPMADILSYEDIIFKETKKSFTLNFKSPTSFTYGKGSLPLPVPYSIFRSYLLKWNNFCPSDYKINEEILKIIDSSIFPARYSLNTKILDMKDYKIVGFTGDCKFEVLGEISKEDLTGILTLVCFSFYCGTGSKTTIGMGQTFPSIGVM